MSAKYELIGMDPYQEAETIRQLWLAEAIGYAAAGEVLRSELDPGIRSEAIELREQHLEHCDALLDAYSTVSEMIVEDGGGPVDAGPQPCLDCSTAEKPCPHMYGMGESA